MSSNSDYWVPSLDLSHEYPSLGDRVTLYEHFRKLLRMDRVTRPYQLLTDYLHLYEPCKCGCCSGPAEDCLCEVISYIVSRTTSDLFYSEMDEMNDFFNFLETCVFQLQDLPAAATEEDHVGDEFERDWETYLTLRRYVVSQLVILIIVEGIVAPAYNGLPNVRDYCTHRFLIEKTLLSK